MNDLKIIKKRIFEEKKVEEFLEKLDCENIKEEQGGNLFTAQLPESFNSSNKRSVQIRNVESLPSHIRSKGVKGDVYSLVSYIVNEKRTSEEINKDLPKAKEWIIEVMGYYDIIDGRYKRKNKYKDVNNWLKKIKK